MVIQAPAPITPSFVLPPLQVPTRAGLAPGPAALAFNAALTDLEASVGDTTLLQAEYPLPVADTTLLQAEINLGMAVMTEVQGGVIPEPSLLFPKPGALVPTTALAEVLAEPVLPGELPFVLPTGLLVPPAPEAPPATGPPADLDALALAESNLAEASVLQAMEPLPEPVAGSTLLQAEVAAEEAAAATDPSAEALAAQALANEEEQQAFQAVLQAGVANVPLLAGGPSQGIAATLAGAGWVHVPDATNAAEAAALWAFHLPYRTIEVPAVTGAARGEVAGTRNKPQKAGELLKTYSPHGEQIPPLDATQASILDLLD